MGSSFTGSIPGRAAADPVRIRDRSTAITEHLGQGLAAPQQRSDAPKIPCEATAAMLGDNGFDASMLDAPQADVGFIDRLMAENEGPETSPAWAEPLEEEPTQRYTPKPATPLYSLDSQGRADGGRTYRGSIGIDEVDERTGVGLRTMNLRGERQYGASGASHGGRLDATAWELGVDPAKSRKTGPLGVLRVGDAGGVMSYDGETAETGYRADVASAEVGFRQVDPGSRTDRGHRVGVSAGAPSFGFRFYDQDLDEDGRREKGLGFSVPAGPAGLSFDRVSETPYGDGAMELLDAATNAFHLPLSATRVNDVVGSIAGPDHAPSTLVDDQIQEWLGRGR